MSPNVLKETFNSDQTDVKVCSSGEQTPRRWTPAHSAPCRLPQTPNANQLSLQPMPLRPPNRTNGNESRLTDRVAPAVDHSTEAKMPRRARRLGLPRPNGHSGGVANSGAGLQDDRWEVGCKWIPICIGGRQNHQHPSQEERPEQARTQSKSGSAAAHDARA